MPGLSFLKSFTYNKVLPKIEAVENELNLKQPNMVLISGDDGKVATSEVSVKELSFLSNVNNNIQTQLNAGNTTMTNTSNELISRVQNVSSELDSNILATSNNVIEYLNIDSMPNGEIFKYVENGFYYGDLNIVGNLTVKNYSINGVSQSFFSSTITDVTEIASDSLNGPVLKIVEKAENNIIELGHGTETKVTMTHDGKLGIGTTTPVTTLDINGNVSASGTINGITTQKLSYLSGVTDNIQSQIDNFATLSGTSESSIGNLTLTSSSNMANNITNMSNISVEKLSETYSDLTSYIDNKTDQKQDIINFSKTFVKNPDDNSISVKDTIWDTINSSNISYGNNGNVVNVFDNKIIINSIDVALISDVNSKQDLITGAATTITTNLLPANKLVVSDANGKVASDDFDIAKLDNLTGVTTDSTVQTQIDDIQTNMNSTTNELTTKRNTEYTNITQYVDSMTASELAKTDGKQGAINNVSGGSLNKRGNYITYEFSEEEINNIVKEQSYWTKAPENEYISYSNVQVSIDNISTKIIQPFNEPRIVDSGIIKDNTSFVDLGNNQYIYSFKNTSNDVNSISFPQDTVVDVLIVAGGGAGGSGENGVGGGGGGGSVYVASNMVVPAYTEFPIIVGEGGKAAFRENGGNSSAFGITTIGGGAGGNSDAIHGISSGGGGGGGGINYYTSNVGMGGIVEGTISKRGADGVILQHIDTYAVPSLSDTEYVKYPRENFTQDKVTFANNYHTVYFTYSDGTQLSSKSSSVFNADLTTLKAFDGIKNHHITIVDYSIEYPDCWMTAQESVHMYLQDGTYPGLEGRTDYRGEWVMIDLGEQIILSKTKIYIPIKMDYKRRPREFRIYGTNDLTAYTSDIDSSEWNVVYEGVGFEISGDLVWHYEYDIPDNTQAYRYYCIIIHKVWEGGVFSTLGEWELFARKEITTYYPLLTKFPRENMDATTFTNSDGVTVACSSSTFNNNDVSHSPFKLFDGVLYSEDTESWLSGDNTYDESGNAVVTYLSEYPGELVMIDLGEDVILKETKLYPLTAQLVRQPKEFRIYGTNNKTAFGNINDNQWNKVYDGINPNTTIVNLTDTQPIITKEIYDTTIVKYPKVPYTAASSDITFSSTDEQFNQYFPYKAFDGITYNISNTYFTGQYYNGTDRTHIRSLDVNINGYGGEWLRIDLKENIVLKSYKIYPQNGDPGRWARAPGDFKIFGSKDNITHYELDLRTNITWPSGNSQIFEIPNNNENYRYYTIVVNKIAETIEVAGNFAFVISELELYGNPDTTIVKYPRENLSGNTYTYSDGTVVKCRASDFNVSNDTYNVWRAFDNVKYTSRWVTNYNRYQSNGYANTDRSDFYFKDHSAFYGEYIIIDLGEKIVLDHYIHYGLNGYNNRSPVDFRVYATNDDSAYDNTKSDSWIQIDERIGVTGYADNTGKTFTLATTPAAYRYFAIITNKNGGGGYLEFSELELYGNPDTTVEHQQIGTSGEFYYDFVKDYQTTLVKYPRELSQTAQTVDNQQIIYTDGKIVKFKASTVYETANSNSYRPSNLFDGQKTGTGWVGWSSGTTGTPSYNTTTGEAIYTYKDDGYAGEWLMIDLGEQIYLQKMNVYPESNDNKRQPRQFRIYASNSQAAYDNGVNDSDWVLIHERLSDVNDVANNNMKEYDILSSSQYRYYYIVINKTYNGMFAHFAELELFGYPEITNATNYTMKFPRDTDVKLLTDLNGDVINNVSLVKDVLYNVKVDTNGTWKISNESSTFVTTGVSENVIVKWDNTSPAIVYDLHENFIPYRYYAMVINKVYESGLFAQFAEWELLGHKIGNYGGGGGGAGGGTGSETSGNALIVPTSSYPIGGAGISSSITKVVTGFPNRTKDMLAWYKFDGNLNDSSGNGQDLTLLSGTNEYDTTVIHQGVSSLKFNGSTSYSVTPPTGTDPFNSNTITISVWHYATAGGTQSILSTRHTSWFDGWTLYAYPSTGEYNLQYLINGPTWEYISSGVVSSFVLNTWHHICVTIDENKVGTFYINSVKVGQTILSNFISTTSTILYVGANMGGGSNKLTNGTRLDDVRIYNRALTPDEVTELYEFNKPKFAEESTDLLMWYKFDKGDAAEIDSYTINSGTLGTTHNLENYDTLQESSYGVVGNAHANLNKAYLQINSDFDSSALNECSICFWLKKKGINTASDVIFADSSTSSEPFKIRRMDTTDYWDIQCFGGVFDTDGYLNDWKADHIWNHYSFVFENASGSTQLKIYKNNTLVYTNTNGTWTNTIIAKPTIGDTNPDTSLMGNLDDIRVYNRVLTTTELYDLYNYRINVTNYGEGGSGGSTYYSGYGGGNLSIGAYDNDSGGNGAENTGGGGGGAKTGGFGGDGGSGIVVVKWYAQDRITYTNIISNDELVNKQDILTFGQGFSYDAGTNTLSLTDTPIWKDEGSHVSYGNVKVYDNKITIGSKIYNVSKDFFNDTSDMLAWYKFDGANGETDSSGNGYTATVFGSPVLSETSLSITKDNYLKLPDNIIDHAKDICISFWYRFDNDLIHARLLDIAVNNNYANNDKSIRIERYATYSILGFNIDGIGQYQANFGHVTNGDLIHLTWVIKKDGTWIIYKNGIQIYNAVKAYPSTNIYTHSYLGKSNWLNEFNYDNRITLRDFRIYNRALTPDEIAILYNNTPPVSRYFLNDTSDMYVWYKFNGDLNDDSGYSRDAIGYNSPTFDENLKKEGTHSVQFAGGAPGTDSQYLTVPSTDFSLWDGFTVSCWVYFEPATDNNTRIFDFGDGAAANNILMLRLNTGNKINIYVFDGASGTVCTTVNDVIVNNTWMHISWVITKTPEWKLYVNGTLQPLDSSNSRYPVSTTYDNCYIAKSNSAADGYFKGKMDDFRLYKRALSGEEVKALYHMEIPTYSTGELYVNTIKAKEITALGVAPSLQIGNHVTVAKDTQQTGILKESYATPTTPYVSPTMTGTYNTDSFLSPDDNEIYEYAQFTDDGTITFSEDIECDILMVGGGGAGSGDHGGGGGAGKLILFNDITVPAETYTINIGEGGICPNDTAPGQKGGNTELKLGATLLCKAEGGGGAGRNDGGEDGGSGAGGDAYQTRYVNGNAILYSPILFGISGTALGNDGGNHGLYQIAGHGGGGGGSGTVGQTASGGNSFGYAGNGGDGVYIVGGINLDTNFNLSANNLGVDDGSGNYYLAGGGGGGSWGIDAPPGTGGKGGGGAGGQGKGYHATNAIVNTGSGGGGGRDSAGRGGSGGSGLFVIRWKKKNQTISSNPHPTMTGTYNTDSFLSPDDNEIYEYAQFTDDGTITFPQDTACDVLVVGGGGAGNPGKGAGSAGGIIYYSDVIFSKNTYHVEVGKGGVLAGENGQQSRINGTNIDLIAVGGTGSSTIDGASGGTNPTNTISLSSSATENLDLVAKNGAAAFSNIVHEYPRHALSGGSATNYIYTAATVNSLTYRARIHSGYNTIGATTTTYTMNLFNKNTSDLGWEFYTNGFTSTNVRRTGYAGEYIMIDLVNPIILDNFILYPRVQVQKTGSGEDTAKRMPKYFRLYATNTDAAFTGADTASTGVNHPDWILLYERTSAMDAGGNSADGIDYPTQTTTTPMTVSTNTITSAYRYYMLIVNSNWGDGWGFGISEWKLNGKEIITGGGGGTGTDAPELTSGTSVPDGGDATMVNIYGDDIYVTGGGTGSSLDDSITGAQQGGGIYGYGGNSLLTSHTSGGSGIVIIRWKKMDENATVVSKTENIKILTIDSRFTNFKQPTVQNATNNQIIKHPTEEAYYTTFTDTTTPGSITFEQDTVCDVLVVGGGGSGNIGKGGGSSGGMLYATEQLIPSGTYSITVGAGGVNGNGGDSTVFGATAKGGLQATTVTGATNNGTNVPGTTIASWSENKVAFSGGTPFSEDISIYDTPGTNLVLWHKFDSDLTDSSPNAWNASAGNFSWDTTNKKTGTASILFPTNNTGGITLNSALNPYNIWNNSSSGMTFSLWFRHVPQTGVWGRLFDFQANTNIDSGFFVSVKANPNNIQTGIYFKSGSTSYSYSNWGTTPGQPLDGKWHHVVWSIDKLGTWTIYYDNVNLNVSKTSMPIVITTYNFRAMGYSAYSADSSFSGNIDDFRIYDIVLSTTEIAKIYNMTVTLTTPSGGGGVGSEGGSPTTSIDTPNGGNGFPVSIITPNELYAGGGGANEGERVPPSGYTIGYGGNSSETTAGNGGSGIVIIKWYPTKKAVHGSKEYCLRTKRNIWMDSANVIWTSDIRIKKDIEDINDDSALEQVLSLEPKTYKYKNVMERGNNKVFGFVSQQVEKVIPEATTKTANFIPNIYEHCEFVNTTVNNIPHSTITLPVDYDIATLSIAMNSSNISTRVRVINEKNENAELDFLLTSNVSGYGLMTEDISDFTNNSSNVFVYGTEVEDLTTIDKSYLYTLNVCATQVLSRKIDTLEASNSAMVSRIEQLESELNTLQNSFK